MPRPRLALAAALALILVGVASPASAAACSMGSLDDDARLKSFSGYVADADTGAALYDSDGTDPRSTGSVLKLLTATAALQVLGPDHRIATTVVQGAQPGTVVLVGGGDPTLSRASASFYPGAPKLADLARQVKRNGTKVTKIVVDASLWNDADAWDPTWKRSEQRIGYLSETSALQVDGDRADPRVSVSPRGTNPARTAGRWFAKALGVPTVEVVTGTAPEGAKRLGVVRSQPVKRLVKQLLLTSDGTLAESLARVTSIAAGADGSAKSLDGVVSTALGSYGLDTSGLRIRDGSGLSTKNAVSPRFVTDLLRMLRAGDPKRLTFVYDGLSIAGKTGSLASRFGGSPARRHVLAKTGWLDTEYSLAGVVHAEDGSTQVFAFYAIGRGISPSAKGALDALATRVYTCGSRLSG